MKIKVLNAYENNLKNIDVEIPLYIDTVVTGVSGSGKTTLVYDVLFNESQRMFFQNTSQNSISLRQPAQVESIKNLPATLSVSQHSYNVNPRSTIGTFTNLSDYLRSLFASWFNYHKKVKMKPNDFSFNNPTSYCSTCRGLGTYYEIDLQLVIPDTQKTLENNAVQWFKGSPDSLSFKTLKKLCEVYDIPTNVKFSQLSKENQDIILFSKPNKIETIRYKIGSKYRTRKVPLQGAISEIQEYFERLEKPSNFKKIEKYLKVIECPSCRGFKLNNDYLNMKIDGMNISEIENLNFLQLKEWFSDLKKLIFQSNLKDLDWLLDEIDNLIQSFQQVNLAYLTPSRVIPSLSGGELQRTRFAKVLTNTLTGILYIFDEPCQGLHIKDIPSVQKNISQLINRGNTVISIEHNIDFIKNSSNIILLGPGAADRGGYICEELAYLNKELKSIEPEKIENVSYLEFKNIKKNNIIDLDVKFPLYGVTAITGPSGSGKSTLLDVIETLIDRRKETLGVYKSMSDSIKKVYRLNQRPISKNSRSKVITYLDIFEDLRKVFSNLPEAIKKGYGMAFFSPNVEGGRCEVCKGLGEIRVEVSNYDDVYIPCSECESTGYREEVLDIKFRGLSIYEVLNTPIKELMSLFPTISKIYNTLKVLEKLGLDYLTLGQSSATLSGGEAQRIKLAKILSQQKANPKKCLFLLDEPSTGLASHDIYNLINLLNEIAKDNTVVIVEHNINFVKNIAQYLIDLEADNFHNTTRINIEGLTPEVYKSKKLSFK